MVKNEIRICWNYIFSLIFFLIFFIKNTRIDKNYKKSRKIHQVANLRTDKYIVDYDLMRIV